MTYNEKEILDNDKQIEQPQKTITNKLRAMLDERGVNWDYSITGATTTKFRINGVDLAFMPMRDGFVCTTILTPEQVIAVTLDIETCKLVETKHERETSDEFGKYTFSYWAYDCSECGHENAEYGRFCAGCGKKVVD